MCCFSRHVDSVSDTNIFARSAERTRQFVVYSMKLVSKEDLAMILPIPVPPSPPEDAVRFIDLNEYPEFFADLRKGFPVPPAPGGLSRDRIADTSKSQPKLQVYEVGEFEASFVPTIRDFGRLDERFRLPDNTWEKLPAYRSFGFAVFKLKEGAKTIHPMAFEFPRVNPKRIFFPTVHIHDGKVHPSARFDHTLYCQITDAESLDVMAWRESPKLADDFMKIDKAKGLVAANRHCYQRRIQGVQKNSDVLV